MTKAKHVRVEIEERGIFHRTRRIVCSCGWKSSWHYSSKANNEEMRAHKASALLDNDRLSKLAAAHPPPPEWCDEDVSGL